MTVNTMTIWKPNQAMSGVCHSPHGILPDAEPSIQRWIVNSSLGTNQSG